MDYTGGGRDLGRSVADRASETFEFLKTATTKGKSPDVIKTVAPAEPSTKQLSMTEQAASLPPTMTMTLPKPMSGSGPSIISVNVELNGAINTPDELYIFGSVDGNVRASTLTICEGGSVKGEVAAQTVIVHGSVEGKIYAQKVQLCIGAVVRGDIVHGQLGVDTMATFEGMSKRSQDPLAESSLPAVTPRKR